MRDMTATSSRVQIMKHKVYIRCNIVHTAGWRLQWLDSLEDENKLLRFWELKKLYSLQYQICRRDLVVIEPESSVISKRCVERWCWHRLCAVQEQTKCEGMEEHERRSGLQERKHPERVPARGTQLASVLLPQQVRYLDCFMLEVSDLLFTW